jgi:hypothetical protein
LKRSLRRPGRHDGNPVLQPFLGVLPAATSVQFVIDGEPAVLAA